MRKDIIEFAVKNLLKRRMRSWLTALSVLIGIMAIFALVSFGAGVQNYVDELAQEMGTNKLIIQPKGFTPPGESSVEFGDDDVETVEKARGIASSAPVIIRNIEIREDKDETGKWVYLNAGPTSGEGQRLLKETYTLDIEEGRELRDNDKYKAVLGNNYLEEEEVFRKPLKVHDKIYINGKGFRVVGFYESLGNPTDDNNVYIPIETAKEIFDTENYQYIIAETNKDPDEVIDKVEKDLRDERGLEEDKEDFYVQTFEDAMSTFTNIVDTLNMVLVLIALISVVVSAVNIANAMYTSVIERTRDIGIMKAIGARNINIKNMFLIESGMIGFIGGAIGIGAGYLIAEAGGYYAKQAGFSMLQPAYPLWLIIGCLVFSFLIGMISGYFPAKQASELKPVDALRYE